MSLPYPPPQQQPQPQPPISLGRPATVAPWQGPPATRPNSRAAEAVARSRTWARPAGTGARIAAYTLDALAVTLLGIVAGVVFRSAWLGVIVGLEVVAILWVLEARTGATLGNLMLRLRTTRDDAPFSPGVPRAMRRGLVQAAGTAVALIGGWIVVATSAADPLRAGRSLADRAGRTLVVRLPAQAELQHREQLGLLQAPPLRPPLAAQALRHPGLPASALPSVIAPPPMPSLAGQPELVSAPQPQFDAMSSRPAQPGVPVSGAHAVPRPSAQPASTGRRSHTGTTPPRADQAPWLSQPGAASALEAAPDALSIPAQDAPVGLAAAPDVRQGRLGRQLLLSFDTGQRERMPTSSPVNLGRKPVPTEQDDALVAVRDPDGTVSKTHLRIEFGGGTVWVIDLGSTNGSEIFDDEGERTLLQPGSRVVLEEGSRVRIGDRSFTVAMVLDSDS